MYSNSYVLSRARISKLVPCENGHRVKNLFQYVFSAAQFCACCALAGHAHRIFSPKALGGHDS